MGIGKPGVQREHRQFHAEAHQEAQVAEQAKHAAGGAGDQFAEVEGEGAIEGQSQAAEQDQQGGCGGVQDELGGRVLTLLAAPDRNQEIDRDKLQFPGQEEQQEILREKHQGLGRGLDQQQREVEPGLLLNIPTGRHGEQRDQSGEHHQRSRQPIGGEGPLQANDRDPGEALHQLEARNRTVIVLAVDVKHQAQVRQQGDQGDSSGKLGVGAVSREEHHQRSDRDRQQGDQAQPGKRGWRRQGAVGQGGVAKCGAGNRCRRGQQGQIGVHRVHGFWMSWGLSRIWV